MADQPNKNAAVDDGFPPYYLQLATQELSDDLDKVRNADDFKADSVSFLVHALRQGAGQFSPEDRQRVTSDVGKANGNPST